MAGLTGLRTVVNDVHHVPPAQAQAVLDEAVAARAWIGVFPRASRGPTHPTRPFWRPFRWRWLPGTWHIPLIQPFVRGGGVASQLRVSHIDALRPLAGDLDIPDARGPIGHRERGSAPPHAPHRIGRRAPPAPAKGAEPGAFVEVRPRLAPRRGPG